VICDAGLVDDWIDDIQQPVAEARPSNNIQRPIFPVRAAVSGVAVGDAGFVQVVLGHFDIDLITDGDADKVFAHFAGNVREDFVAVGQFDPKHGARQHLRDGSRQFDVLFSWHGEK
jgi:hypothetical protein